MKAKARHSVSLDSNNHSVFSLNFHCIICVKYRRKAINDEVYRRIAEILSGIAIKHKIKLLEGNHDQDHIHLLFSSVPSANLSKFLNSFKSASSRVIKKEFPAIRNKLWKEFFWSKSYCLLTTGGASLDIVKAYIESQGEP